MRDELLGFTWCFVMSAWGDEFTMGSADPSCRVNTTISHDFITYRYWWRDVHVEWLTNLLSLSLPLSDLAASCLH